MRHLFSFSQLPQDGMLPVMWLSAAALSKAMAEPWSPHGGPFKRDTPVAAFVQAASSYIPRANGLIYFDAEAVSAVNTPAKDILIECFKAYDKRVPYFRRACYGGPPSPFGRREDVIAAGNDKDHPMREWIRSNADFYSYLDYMDMGSYIIGEQFIDRDFDCFTAWRQLVRQYLPHARPIWSVWGCYNWPPYPPMPPAVQTRYADFATRYDDDVIVFDYKPKRDDALVSRLKERIGV